jgi:hypothetical protein
MTAPCNEAKPAVPTSGKPIHRPGLPQTAAPDSFPGVDLSTYLRMDPHLLLGLLNTELRNHCDSLDDLVKTHGLDARKLTEKMAKAGYEYQPEQNQFR